jgi:transcriptional regulator with XRE-family HTH domain
MPRVSRLKLPPLDLGGETIGDRVARIRKERGFTQAELAAKVGIIQTIVSAIEKGALKLSGEMASRFAVALEVSTDDLLMPVKKRSRTAVASRKVLRRVEQIETLPAHHQQTVLKSLDMMLSGLRNAS